MSEHDDRIARYAEQLERLRDLPSPQREERVRDLIAGLPPEDREEFFRFAQQKRAHHEEQFEFHAELLRALGAGEPLGGRGAE